MICGGFKRGGSLSFDRLGLTAEQFGTPYHRTWERSASGRLSGPPFRFGDPIRAAVERVAGRGCAYSVEKADALKRLAAQIEGIITPAPDNVVPLRRLYGCGLPNSRVGRGYIPNVDLHTQSDVQIARSCRCPGLTGFVMAAVIAESDVPIMLFLSKATVRNPV